MNSERLQAMLADACFGARSDEAFAADLRGYLGGHGLDPEDITALLAAPRRLGLYRRLIRHNVLGVIDAMLGKTRSRLDALVPGAFDRMATRFLDESGPRTPHLRDVPREFLAWASPHWREDAAIPVWITDFAAYELVDFTIGVAPRAAAPPPLADVAADRPLVFAPPSVILELRWAVHELDDAPGAVPPQRDTWLFVYRDGEHRTRFLDLTPLAASILDRLLAGDALVPAMVSACATRGVPLDEQILAGAARLLADLGERGVLLGARA